MKTALILTYNRFPEGDAGAVRQDTFAKLFMELDYDIFLIGMGPATGGVAHSYDGIRYISFRNKKNSILYKVNNFLGFKYRLKKFLEGHEIFDVILAIDLPLNAMRYIEKYAIRHRSVLLHDSVEWYSPEEFSLGRLAPEYFRKDLKNRFFFKKPWRIIAISSYLEQHFLQKGLLAVRIPVIMDMKKIGNEKRTVDNKTVIVYAGAPGKKDCFGEIIEAIYCMNEDELAGVEFRIIGVTNNQFRNSLNIPDEKWRKIKSYVRCLGRVSREVVLKNLEEADYTILLRQAELRYAKAGFPTKVPESLASSTPVICNLSSDLGFYLVDGKNSFIVKDNTVQEITKTLKRAIKCPVAEREKMRNYAYETARNNFDYKKYEESLKTLIETKL